MELTNDDRSHEVRLSTGEIFILRDWTKGMQERVERECLRTDSSGKVSYDIALDRRLKLEMALADWQGVTANGEPVPCTQENRDRLPVGVQIWLVRKIEDRAGYNISEAEKKN